MQMWKAIEAFPRYEVSSHGRVRNKITGRVLSPGNAKGGYKFVVLTEGGEESVVYVHVLVAEAFIGPCPEGKEIDHKDDDPGNNRRRNLQYLTHAENGRKSKRTKLTSKYVKEIRKCYSTGFFTLKLLGEIFGVNSGTVHNVV